MYYVLFMRLDLHGIKHEEVTRRIDLFVWENIQMNTPQIQIITGNSTPMKNIVRECLAEYNLVPYEGYNNSATLYVDLI